MTSNFDQAFAFTIGIEGGVPLWVVLPGVELESRSKRPIGSWVYHPLVTVFDDMASALKHLDAVKAGLA